ncbi:cytochrome c biogenesis CcdA family protein, partial [Alcaligenes pakistanensis]
AGVMVALAGLSVMGVLRMPMSLQRYYRFESGKAAGPGGATVMGLAFGFGWTPCIGPILAGILMMGASTASAGKASVLLSVYALGLGVPFILAACFLTPFLQRMT